jgi:hypothetical protein
MALVREVAEAVKLLSDVVQSTRKMVEAVNDGKKFLEAKHPRAKKEFAELLLQMQSTVEGLADVTGVISRFRFTAGRAADMEPVRFNNYVIDEEKKVVALRGRIQELRADCKRVRVLRDALNAQGETKDWTSMWDLLGDKAAKRAIELATTLSNFYADDQAMINVIERMLRMAEQALEDVSDALAPAGTAYPANVPTATAVLNTYSAAFKQPKRDLDRLVNALSEAHAGLI